MTRIVTRSIIAVAALMAAFADIESQQVVPRLDPSPEPHATAFGVTLSGLDKGVYLGPTFGRSFGGHGILQGRTSASLVADVGSTGLSFACPGVLRHPCDTRELGFAATTTIALEIGTPRREIDGGAFIIAQGGLAALHWSGGGIRRSAVGGSTYTDYGGRHTVAFMSGLAAGVNLPVFGQVIRVQFGVGGLHDRVSNRTSVALTVSRQW
jgi:hypothetical protein